MALFTSRDGGEFLCVKHLPNYPDIPEQLKQHDEWCVVGRTSDQRKQYICLKTVSTGFCLVVEEDGSLNISNLCI